MKKILYLVLVLLCSNHCFAAIDVVYPKMTQVSISANSTFFIGSSDTPLKINGENVKLNSSGAFAHVVTLNEGHNTFILESENDKKNYVINKPMAKGVVRTYSSPQFLQYSERKNYLIVNDNAPLRETPIDSGINRLSHLQRQIPLIVDGEDKGFYRVVLNDNTKAWVSKGDVEPISLDYLTNPAELKSYQHKETDEYDMFLFEFDKKTPFVIKEGNPFTVTFYNVKNNPNSTYIFEFPVNHKLFGYAGSYEGSKFILKIRKSQKTIKGLNIALDAGHGGTECGAISCLSDKEKDINLAITKYLEGELKSRGANVIMTRKSDVNVGLKERVNIANRENASILISIHGNALPDCLDPNTHRGTSVFYYYEQSKPLAESILKYMTTNVGTKNDNVRQASLALVRNTNALSILIEVAYLINPDDSVLLKDAEFQKKCAKAIADGIENFLHK